MSRRPFVLFAALVLAVVLVAPALAMDDVNVSVQNPSFSWTGKQDQQAGYDWSATVSNPSKRPTSVIVTLHLLDASGNVVASDTKTVEVMRQSQVAVSGKGMLAYADANKATQYRITLEGAES